MNILVINTGSSSIKYRLFNMDSETALVTGLAEKLGEESSILTHTPAEGGKGKFKVEKDRIADHAQGLSRIVELLIDREYGVIQDKSEIAAVGHRVVHGGED
ncbi:MAG: acetate kinase, partial [Acidobacteria bacterium]|nr:acetate kinase [Acidobacteriota bacterium]